MLIKITMCAKQSLKQPAGARLLNFRECENSIASSPVPGNTVRSGYWVQRAAMGRPIPRSVDRDDIGRNAKPEGSSVKGSSPVKRNCPGWPSKYAAAKATPQTSVRGTLGVQAHGMYQRLVQELGRSPGGRVTEDRLVGRGQGLTAEFSPMHRREVRCPHSSETHRESKAAMKEVG